jgi:predicted amidohydrolase
MRVAVVQILNPLPDVEPAVSAGLSRLERAKELGADLVIFPELFLGGYYLDDQIASRAAAAPAALARLQQAVDAHEVSAVLGYPQATAGRPRNSIAILRPGEPASTYAKTHLFRDEKLWFEPGDTLWSGEIAGWSCGVLVCYEIGFPEVARTLALRGVEFLIVPSAFARERRRIWQLATTGRALENGAYLAAANVAGEAGSRRFAGQSRIVDPTGQVLVETADRADMVMVELRKRLVDEVRAGERSDTPAYLNDRRPELYSEAASPEGSPST